MVRVRSEKEKATIRARRIIIWTIASILTGLAGTASAHQTLLTEVNVIFDADGTFEIGFIYDMDAMMMGVSPGDMAPEVYAEMAANTTEEERREMLQGVVRQLTRTIRISFDGQLVTPDIEFPDLGMEEHAIWGELPPGPWPGEWALMQGKIPEGSREFTFRASRIYGPVGMSFLDEAGDVLYQTMLATGTRCEPYALSLPPPPPPSRWKVSRQFSALGFTHIVPGGLDHILFVLGLYLLSVRMRPLLWQVTAFTVAHSVTLGLAMYGVVSLPASVVEPLIALSIAYVAIENLFTSQLKPWRPAVVFGFGLLHGLGFAGVLAELELPRERFLTALVTFNVGVELGQLAVILTAFLAIGWLRAHAWYRTRLTIPASCAIALIALYWTIERTFG